jgi:uncharacterized protein (DUF1501 family)
VHNNARRRHRGDRKQNGTGLARHRRCCGDQFGGTARINGSGGTDHWTGTIAVLVGGATE